MSNTKSRTLSIRIHNNFDRRPLLIYFHSIKWLKNKEEDLAEAVEEETEEVTEAVEVVAVAVAEAVATRTRTSGCP